MVLNTPEFGRLIRQVRGDTAQDKIDERGGPFRQRQTEIERGDPIDLSPAVLAQLDTAHHWTQGAAEAILTSSDALLDHPERFDDLSPRMLGIDTAGREIPLPRVLAVSSLDDVLPLFHRWDGPVLVDVSADQGLASMSWPSERPLYRTGANDPAEAEPIAIDPLAGLTSYQGALVLADALVQFHRSTDWLRQRTDAPRDYIESAALSLLFVVSSMLRDGLDGLTALSQFARDPGMSPPGSQQWSDFHHASGLSSRLAKPDSGAARLFDGLMAARDKHIDIVINPTASQPTVTASAPRTVAITELASSVLFYDSSVSPELPVVLDWAFRDLTMASPLLVIATADALKLVRSHVILPDSHLHPSSPWTPPGGIRTGALAALLSRSRLPRLSRVLPEDRAPLYVPPGDHLVINAALTDEEKANLWPEQAAGDHLLNTVTTEPFSAPTRIAVGPLPPLLLSNRFQTVPPAPEPMSQPVQWGHIDSPLQSMNQLPQQLPQSMTQLPQSLGSPPRDTSSSDAALAFYHRHRHRFGPFTSARLQPASDDETDEPPLVLIDAAGNEMRLWHVGFRGAPAHATRDILVDAGFADEDVLRGLTSTPAERPLTVQPSRLRIPIGRTTDDSHTPCYIDLTRPSTHGLLVGTSGSGRTHLLRTIITAATDIHTPAELTVIAVDFSRHDGFTDLTNRTSTLAPSRALTVITAADPSDNLADPFTQAVRGEIEYRSQLLSEATQQTGQLLADVASYNALRNSGQAAFAPIPTLLVVVAEFHRADNVGSSIIGELDDALDIGRALDIHFLFAASTLTGRAATASLTARLGYRIALRTTTVQESHTVIGSNDAAEIPAGRAGVGFLRVGDGPLVRFRTPTPEMTA